MTVELYLVYWKTATSEDWVVVNNREQALQVADSETFEDEEVEIFLVTDIQRVERDLF